MSIEALPPGNQSWRDGCIGPFYDYDICPCDVPECPACGPRRERAVAESVGEARRAIAQADRLLIDSERGLVKTCRG